VLQPDGGFLIPEACIASHARLAERHGAVVKPHEPVVGWDPTPNGGVVVRTAAGRYEAERLIISAGSWVGGLVPSLASLLTPERQVLAWFGLEQPDWYAPERFPVFNLTVDEGRYYGFPAFGLPGFKVGRYHHLDEAVDPDHVDRDAHPRDEAVLREFASKYFAGGAGETLALKTCLFTNTPDEHFIIDTLPDAPQVIVASPCSGHGFKFASVVGNILADLATTGRTTPDLGWLSLRRFAGRSSSAESG
jgi:sarcosine oxidase